MTYQPGDKYILYLPNAVEIESRLDGSLCKKIETVLTKFQGDWGPERAFAKGPSKTGTRYIRQIKHDRGVMRGFASWWSTDSTHVLCVLDLYKKTNEDGHWNRVQEFDNKAERLHDRLDNLHENGLLEDKLNDLKDDPEHKVILPD